MAPYFNRSARSLSRFLAKYSAPMALSAGVARTSSGQWGILAASFWAALTSILYDIVKTRRCGILFIRIGEKDIIP